MGRGKEGSKIAVKIIDGHDDEDGRTNMIVF